ncbi:hypothetical protein [Paracoccus sp. Ld10]|uniref:hypothetical protein n=1 Tax=Paracoccus sp. Ld10 TaxID=649158 RepID=UPI003866AE94
MRGDVMQWMGRLVAVVFGLGVLALLGAVAVLVRQAEGVPPWPIFLGLLGLVALILLAGACLALISIAVSARRGAEALQRLGGTLPAAVAEPEPEPVAQMQGPFTPTGLADASARPVRPGRSLVATR